MDLALSSPAFAGHWPDLRTWWRLPQELRIDVDPSSEGALEQELDTLHGRLYGLPTEPLSAPRFVMHRREADGEWYVYVEDRVERRLAGYTVFNRLIEVDRHTDPHVRAPHSKSARAYQRRGLATAVYGWALGSGRRDLPGFGRAPVQRGACAVALPHPPPRLGLCGSARQAAGVPGP